MVYKFLDKTSSGNGVATEPNYQLANKLHRQIITKFKRRKFYSSFRDNAVNKQIEQRNEIFIVCN